MVDLPGISTKLHPVKIMRWFSCSSRHALQGVSFWPLKLILSHHKRRPDADPEDLIRDPPHVRNMKPKAEIAQLKADNQGFALGAKLLCPWLHSRFRVYFHGTKSAWDFYTAHLEIKTPQGHVKWLMSIVDYRWVSELARLLEHALRTGANLIDMGLDWTATMDEEQTQSDLCVELLDFVLNMASNLSFSMIQFEAPPYCYCGIMSASDNTKARACAKIKFDSQVLFGLEGIREVLPVIDEWCVDVKDLIAMPVRIIYATYSRDKFRASSADGKRHMATLFQHIPDNVCVC